jgi:hypothetical protein
LPVPGLTGNIAYNNSIEFEIDLNMEITWESIDLGFRKISISNENQNVTMCSSSNVDNIRTNG